MTELYGLPVARGRLGAMSATDKTLPPQLPVKLVPGKPLRPSPMRPQ